MSDYIEAVMGWSIQESCYEGFRCLSFRGQALEMHVTLDVGPRVIGLQRPGEPNVFYVKDSTQGVTGGDEYRGYGGHRFWLAPEFPELTYLPENLAPVVWTEGDVTWFTGPACPYGAQKLLGIGPENGGRVEILHRVKLLDHYSGGPHIPWAISVMRQGGWVAARHPERPESQKLPSHPIALWSYSAMNDLRFTWGERWVRLKQSSAGEPTKFGMYCEPGFACYALPEVTFFKSFEADPAASYPDFGCNFEAYTRHDMLEVESLSAVYNPQPGMVVTHKETWWLGDPLLVESTDDVLDELLSR